MFMFCEVYSLNTRFCLFLYWDKVLLKMGLNLSPKMLWNQYSKLWKKFLSICPKTFNSQIPIVLLLPYHLLSHYGFHSNLQVGREEGGMDGWMDGMSYGLLFSILGFYTNTEIKIICIQRIWTTLIEKGSTFSPNLTHIIKAPVCFH